MVLGGKVRDENNMFGKQHGEGGYVHPPEKEYESEEERTKRMNTEIEGPGKERASRHHGEERSQRWERRQCGWTGKNVGPGGQQAAVFATRNMHFFGPNF